MSSRKQKRSVPKKINKNRSHVKKSTPKEVLITGGAGYVGSHAALFFLKKGYKVVVLDNLSTGFQGAAEVLKKYGNLEFYQTDLRDFPKVKQVFLGHKYECIFHFAALASVFDCMTKPHDYFSVNVQGSLNLFEAAKLNKVKNIVVSSTCAVFGESRYLPMDEKHPNNPTSPYGESKLMMEKILRWFGKIFGLNYVIFRYYNVCGADKDGAIGDSQDPSTHLMQNAIRGALGIEPFKITCPEVKTPDKTPIRDYVDINDLIDAHYLAYKYLKKGGQSEDFNLGRGKGFSVKEIVAAVEKIMKVKIPLSQGDPRPGEYAKVYTSYKKAHKLLDWNPYRTMEDSVESLKKWYTLHPHGFITPH